MTCRPDYRLTKVMTAQNLHACRPTSGAAIHGPTLLLS
jgi:hypothetical protein